MQIMINIDEDAYKEIKKIVADGNEMCFMQKLIAKGTPLPKGHGRLIDADEIQFERTEFETYGDYCIAFDAIDQADTIIEADTERSGEE